MKFSKQLHALLPKHIHIPFEFGELLGGRCFLSSICWQFSYRNTCNARRAPCVLLNLSGINLAAVWVEVMEWSH